MSMDFIVDEKVIEIDIDGSIFKYKPATAGDEISWFKDYSFPSEQVIVDKETGKETKYQTMLTDQGKLSLCKLRNIIEVPFNKEELYSICDINKEYKLFSDSEKDILFQKFKSDVYNRLIIEVDKQRTSKKE